MSETATSMPASGSRPPRRRRLGWATAGLLVALLTFALVDAGLVLRDLRTAEGEARVVRTALEAGGLREAVVATEAASQASERADRRLARWHWHAASSMPLIGTDVTTLRALARTGATAAAIAEDALQVARPVIDDGAGALIAEGRLQVELLADLAEAVQGADLTALAAAREQLATVADAPRSAALRDAARRVLDVTARLEQALPEAADTLTLAVDLLGGDGPRRYLVAVQHPGELRGTGGLIGFLAVLELRAGEVTLAEPTGIDRDTAIDGTVLVPLGAFSRSTRFEVDAPADYQARYGSVGGAVFLPSTNVDPDLPTVAPLVLAQYAQASGEVLDGLLTIDPLGLQLLLEAIGPLDVPDQVAGLSSALPDPIPAEMLAQVLLIDAYEELGGGSIERRRYHAEVAGAALRTLLSGDGDPLALARALDDAISARHVQLFSTEVGEQRRLERLGIAGALRPQEVGDDLLAVTVVNIAGNKADVHVAHRLEHDLLLEVVETDAGPQLWRASVSRLRIENAVDPASDPYISTSLEPTRPGDPRIMTGQLGLVRSWVTLWSTPGATLERASDLTGADLATWQDRIHDLDTVDQLLDTPQGRTTGTEVVLRGPTGIAVDGDRVTYPLTLWRQAKGVADHLDARIEAPAGWRITDIEVAADGPAIGLGPAPFTEPVTVVDRSTGAVSLQGSMTADVRVVVELQRER
ncbi:MAG: DUF4012 domain-containing protein [Nitriliruptoraceae bacterium]